MFNQFYPFAVRLPFIGGFFPRHVAAPCGFHVAQPIHIPYHRPVHFAQPIRPAHFVQPIHIPYSRPAHVPMPAFDQYNYRPAAHRPVPYRASAKQQAQVQNAVPPSYIAYKSTSEAAKPPHKIHSAKAPISEYIENAKFFNMALEDYIKFCGRTDLLRQLKNTPLSTPINPPPPQAEKPSKHTGGDANALTRANLSRHNAQKSKPASKIIPSESGTQWGDKPHSESKRNITPKLTVTDRLPASITHAIPGQSGSVPEPCSDDESYSVVDISHGFTLVPDDAQSLGILTPAAQPPLAPRTPVRIVETDYRTETLSSSSSSSSSSTAATQIRRQSSVTSSTASCVVADNDDELILLQNQGNLPLVENTADLDSDTEYQVHSGASATSSSSRSSSSSKSEQQPAAVVTTPAARGQNNGNRFAGIHAMLAEIIGNKTQKPAPKESPVAVKTTQATIAATPKTDDKKQATVTGNSVPPAPPSPPRAAKGAPPPPPPPPKGGNTTKEAKKKWTTVDLPSKNESNGDEPKAVKQPVTPSRPNGFVPDANALQARIAQMAEQRAAREAAEKAAKEQDKTRKIAPKASASDDWED